MDEIMFRKGVLKKMFFIISILLFVIIKIAIYFLPLLSMHPTGTGEIETGIYAISNKRNDFYLISSNDGYIAIDAGSDIDAIIKSLTELKIDPLEIKYVLLTHSDNDHVAALVLFSNARIYMNSSELPLLNGAVRRSFFNNNALPDGIDLSDLLLFDDGDKLDIGGHIVECISVPGHTAGSTMFLVDNCYLFTGDVFRVNSDGTMFIHPYSMDRDDAQNSLKLISDILKRCSYVFTAHYGYYSSKLILK